MFPLIRLQKKPKDKGHEWEDLLTVEFPLIRLQKKPKVGGKKYPKIG